MAKKIIKDILIKQKEDKLPSKPAPLKEIKSKKSLLLGGLIIIAILSLGMISLINFSSATVRISPHREFINIDPPIGGFRAVKGGSDLAFEIMQFEHEDTQTVQATSISNEGQKARGEIVIYNDSSVSQKLVSQTRFQAPDGKIYRIQEPIIAPANGSVEAMVYADKPGPEYNIGFADFTIPGLKGTNRYEKIYGRSKTEIKGGSMGTVFLVSNEDIENIRNNLKQKIEDYLRETASKQKPVDYLLYQEALKIDFYDDPANPQAGDAINSPDKTFVFKGKGRATGFLIKKDGLSKFLAGKYIQEKDSVKAVNLEALVFNLLFSNSDNTEINFSLRGQVDFVWDIDADALIKDLMAAKSRDYDSVFSRYQRIKKAEIIFRPPWWHFLPKSKSRIYIEIDLTYL